MYVADLLSRNFIKRNNTGEESLTDVIHTVCDIKLAYKNSKEREFIQKTQDDELLGRVLVYCKSGWPKSINEDGELKHYWKLKNKIISSEGLLYYQSRLLIPKTLRKYIIHKLHETHLGITKTKARARKLFYFPGMNTQIEN